MNLLFRAKKCRYHICRNLNTFYFQALAPSLESGGCLQKKNKAGHTHIWSSNLLELEEH